MGATEDRDPLEREVIVDVRGSAGAPRHGVRTALLAGTTLVLGAGVLVLATQSGSDRADLQGRGEGVVVQSTAWGTEVMSGTTEPTDATEPTTTVETVVRNTLAPFVTTPNSSNEPPTTVSCALTTDVMASGTMPPGCPPPPSYQPQDIYRDICEPLGWTTCAEYWIYDELGNEVNRVIGPGDWTLAQIAAESGGGENGSAVKIRDIYPL